MDFVAIDVETANADMASICQIGVARCTHGTISHEWKSYVDPEDYFDYVNVSLHGIDESIIDGAPTFLEVCDTLNSHLQGGVVVCHTHFDRVAMQQACRRHGTTEPVVIWLDSARVARRAWEVCAWKGYGLSNVCNMLGYQFKHHDALEDAKAAAHIIVAAMNHTGMDLDGWLARVGRPIDLDGATLGRKGNPEGALYGEVLVFTGTLGMARREAADLAAEIGCTVASSVTKKISMLVVGDQDITKLAGHSKSTKHRKAEQLICAGQPIRILRETDFRELVRLATVSP
jgi:DNA polymerase III subunit epsilon